MLAGFLRLTLAPIVLVTSSRRNLRIRCGGRHIGGTDVRGPGDGRFLSRHARTQLGQKPHDDAVFSGRTLFSGFSPWESTLKRPDLHVYVPPVIIKT
jgi:hypothetical protein